MKNTLPSAERELAVKIDQIDTDLEKIKSNLSIMAVAHDCTLAGRPNAEIVACALIDAVERISTLQEVVLSISR